MVDEVKRDLDGASNLLVIGILPMDAAATLDLRNQLRAKGARLRVIHNRISAHALDEARRPLGELFDHTTGLTLVPGEEPDMGSIARTLVEIARKKRIEIRGGFVEGQVLDKGGVELLATTPDKKTLRGMLCGALLGPARGIAAALAAVPAGLARCLNARIEKLPPEGDAAAAPAPAPAPAAPENTQ